MSAIRRARGNLACEEMKRLFDMMFLMWIVLAARSDMQRREIPDRYPLAVWLTGAAELVCLRQDTLGERVLGVLLPGGLLLLAAVLAPGAFGGGDLKLAAAGGFFLGPAKILAACAVSVAAGGLYCIAGVVSGRMNRKTEVAFGPFLAAGMAVSLFWGEKIVCWYTGNASVF